MNDFTYFDSDDFFKNSLSTINTSANKLGGI